MRAILLIVRHIILLLILLACGTSEAHAEAGDAYDSVVFPMENFSTGKGRFMGTVHFDENTVIWAKINLAKCVDDMNENILSIGQDIVGWGGDESKNIHIYYKGPDRALQVNLVDNELSRTGVNGVKANVNWVRTTIALKSNILSVKLSKAGLYINGVQVNDVSDNPLGRNSSNFNFGECLAACGYFSDITSLQIGSREGHTGSKATYSITTDGTEPKLTSVTLPVMDYSPEGKPFSALCGDFCDDCKITAVIDLTTCRNADENILSIGDNISEWKTANGNLHFYYNRATGRLKVAYAKAGEYDGGVGYGTEKSLGRPINLGGAQKLTVELSKGSFILKKDGDEKGVQCRALLKKMDSFWLSPVMEVGSKEGGHDRGRTWATYGFVDIESVDGGSARVTFPATLPWTDIIGDGRSRFCATVPTIDYDRQSICALLDISRCSSGENVLSVGTDIGNVAAKCRMDFSISPSSISRFIVDLWMGGKKVAAFLTDKLEDRGNVTVQLTKAGVFVDGKRIVNVSEAFAGGNGFELLKNKVEVGSVAGNSRAVYRSVRLDNSIVAEDTLASLDAFAGYQPEGARLFMVDSVGVDFSKECFEARIDLSGFGADVADHGILSVGTEIKNWGAQGQYNLHLYYVPSEMKVIANLTSGGTGRSFTASQTMVIKKPLLAVRLSEDGLYLNERQCTAMTGRLTELDGLLSKTSLQVGCLQGRPSMARYEYVKVTDDLPYGEFGRLPWNDVQARKNAFVTTEMVDFSRQYIEARIDVSACESYADYEERGECYSETVFSVGSRISACDDCSFSCLNVYYCKAYHKLVFELTDTDTSVTENSRVVDYYLPEGKTDFVLKIASDGVYVDGGQTNHVVRENVESYKSISGQREKVLVSGPQSSGSLSELSPLLGGITRLGIVQIGSMQGEHRSTALYRSVRIVGRGKAMAAVSAVPNSTDAVFD